MRFLAKILVINDVCRCVGCSRNALFFHLVRATFKLFRISETATALVLLARVALLVHVLELRLHQHGTVGCPMK